MGSEMCIRDRYSKVHYRIMPSLDVSCYLEDPCLTLSQFAADSLSHYSNKIKTNVSIFILPGKHILDRVLSLTNLERFSMTKGAQHNETVYVECTSQSGMFVINETTNASIKGLHFIGCGGNTVTQVEQFTLEDTISLARCGRYIEAQH